MTFFTQVENWDGPNDWHETDAPSAESAACEEAREFFERVPPRSIDEFSCVIRVCEEGKREPTAFVVHAEAEVEFYARLKT